MQKDTIHNSATADQQAIVLAIQSNNELVLKEVYARNFRKVESFILKNKGDTQQAKDIYQEAFLAFWQNIRRGKFVAQNESAINGYLYQIAKNKWLDYLRSKHHKKTVSVEQHHASEYTISSPDHMDDENEEKLQRTLECFNALGESCKLLLTKFYFEKKSLTEIASELNLDPASARNKKYRCMQRLRALTLEQDK